MCSLGLVTRLERPHISKRCLIHTLNWDDSFLVISMERVREMKLMEESEAFGLQFEVQYTLTASHSTLVHELRCFHTLKRRAHN